MSKSDERGRLITIEGGEGVGKSSSMDFVAGHLTDRGLPVHQTREPGGTRFAEAVRELLVNRDSAPIPPKAELLLIFAARDSHIESVIRPALERGTWVLCDRFTDASYAYQGGGRQLGQEPVAWLENWIQGSLRPDLTLLLDAPVEVGMARADHRGERDRFESEAGTFMKRVREAYLERAEREPDRIRVIDAAGDRQAVRANLRQTLDDWLADKLPDVSQPEKRHDRGE